VLGIQMNFQEGVIRMEHTEIPMRDPDIREDEAFYAHTATKADEELASKYSTILES
jgi:hypothetical protein